MLNYNNFKMRRASHVVAFVALIATVFFSSCKKEDKADPNQPKITLSLDKFTGKSGQALSFTVNITAPNGISALLISKGVNLKTDSSFGTNGTMKIAATGNNFEYIFKYILSPDEVDKLVGFNFRVEDSKGLAAEKDFTLNTTVSGAQLLFTYRWTLKSKVWKKNPPEENIKDCEKDDSYLFNRDSTMSINYGNSGCTFDGFNIYEKWTLTPDETKLTITYHNVFTLAITNDLYNVTTLTKDKLVMDIAYDLSAFGLTDHEVFVFTYEASPR
ncbi:MAG: lipocalin family protein [Ferruginibacter sp.]